MTSTINERLIDQQNPMHGGVVADFGDSASNPTPSAAPSPAPSRMNSRSPSKQGYERANSVPRSGFSRTWTDTLAFPRSMTMNSILDFESEEAILRKLIDEYNVVNKKGPEGDVPIPAGFADKLTFWYIVGVTLLFGGFMGLGAVGVLLCSNEIPKIWIDNGNFDNYYEDMKYYQGKEIWVLITTLTGLVVGCIRYFTKYPDDLSGFFKEINSCHVEPKHVPLTVTISAISLAGGGCLGPEACLGNMGGGLGTYVSERMKLTEECDRKLVVLGGMGAALGSLFPSPFLGVLLICELCMQLPKSYMECLTVLSVPAIISFSVFYSIGPEAYLPSLDANYVLTMNWEFELFHCWYGLMIGIISGCVCLLQLLSVGICKQVFIRLRQRVDSTGFLSGTIVAPTVGGLILGLIYYTLPLTVGNGNLVSGPLLKNAAMNVHMDRGLLLQSAFAKMLCLAISMNCGLIGGFIFPMLTIGIMAACVAYQMYPDIPLLLFASCFLAGIPSGVCPMPITLIALPCTLFFIGLEQTAPIFIAATTSYCVVVGSGIFATLQSRAAANRGSESAAATDANSTWADIEGKQQYEKPKRELRDYM